MSRHRLSLLCFFFPPCTLNLFGGDGQGGNSSTEWIAITGLIVAIASALATGWGAWFVWQQLHDAREGGQTRIFLDIDKDLQKSRGYRDRIYRLQGTPDDNDLEFIKEIKAVLAQFNTIGLLLKHNLIKEDVFLDEWAENIHKIVGKLGDFIARERKNTFENKWKNLDLLFNKASDHLRKTIPQDIP